jgi:pyridoxamine 5'-phosphate oxidase
MPDAPRRAKIMVDEVKPSAFSSSAAPGLSDRAVAMQRNPASDAGEPAILDAFRADGELAEGGDPFALFAAWMADAERSEPEDANAMALATSDASGLPNVRMVLLKDASPDGFVFYSHVGSQKGREIGANLQCAGVLHWKSLRRQVRFRGAVAQVSAEEADAYFASRSRESRIGAWSSRQSEPLAEREALKQAVQREWARFEGGDIPRPPHWTGFRVSPSSIEFWMNKPFRLHDRLVYWRETPDAPWSCRRLYP